MHNLSIYNGILFRKIFWPFSRKKMFYLVVDKKLLLQIRGEGLQFLWAVKGQNNFGNRILFQIFTEGFYRFNKLKQLKCQLEQITGM